MPKGKAVSVSVSDVAMSKQNFRYQHLAMTMEDGSVWFRYRSTGESWQWTEWECIYTPDPV